MEDARALVPLATMRLDASLRIGYVAVMTILNGSCLRVVSPIRSMNHPRRLSLAA